MAQSSRCARNDQSAMPSDQAATLRSQGRAEARPYRRRTERRSVEVVAEFPEKLVIAAGEASVADLIGGVAGELGSEFINDARIEVARSVVAGIPLGGDGEAAVDGLFEGELASGTIGGGDDVPGEVIGAGGYARTVLELLSEGRVGIVSGVVGALANREENVVANKERPIGRGAFPKLPFEGGREVELADGGGAQAVEIHADFDRVADAEDDAGSERSGRILKADGAVLFVIDLAFCQEVGAGDVEDGFLSVDASRSAEREEKGAATEEDELSGRKQGGQEYRNEVIRGRGRAGEKGKEKTDLTRRTRRSEHRVRRERND